MKKSVTSPLPMIESSTLSDRAMMWESLQSPTIAELALKKYVNYIAESSAMADPAQQLRLQPHYSIFVAEAEEEIRRLQPNFLRRDGARKGRRPIHRIGPHLYETAPLSIRNDALPLSASVSLQRTVAGLIEEIVREQPSLRCCCAWDRVVSYFVEKGWSSPPDASKEKKNPRRIRIDWIIDGQAGGLTIGQFEKIFTRARKPILTISELT